MVNCYYFRCNALITIIPLTMIMMHCVEVWGMAAEKSAARSSGWQGQPERLHWIRVDGRNQLRGGTRSLLNHPLYLSSSYSDYWSEVGKIFSFTPTPTPTQSHFLFSSQLTTVLHSLPSMDGQTRTGWLVCHGENCRRSGCAAAASAPFQVSRSSSQPVSSYPIVAVMFVPSVRSVSPYNPMMNEFKSHYLQYAPLMCIVFVMLKFNQIIMENCNRLLLFFFFFLCP